VALLVRHFSALLRARTGRPAPAFADDALALLARHRWPGNVRELANIVERLAILHAGEPVTAAHVRRVLADDAADAGAVADAALAGAAAAPSAHATADVPLAEALDAYERALIVRALAAAGDNVAEAARRLRTDRPNLYRRMRRLDVPLP
jgi:DNA-binding NtrC family response regulator